MSFFDNPEYAIRAVAPIRIERRDDDREIVMARYVPMMSRACARCGKDVQDLVQGVFFDQGPGTQVLFHQWCDPSPVRRWVARIRQVVGGL